MNSILKMASNNNTPDIEVVSDGASTTNQMALDSGKQQIIRNGTRTVAITWATLIGAGAIRYFSSSGDPPTTERKKRTDQELLQEAAGMNPETLQKLKVG